jgi:DNA polymerase beta
MDMSALHVQCPGPKKDIKVKIRIIFNMDKDLLIQQFQIIIHAIHSENTKAAPFKIRQYTDAIKLIQTYPQTDIKDVDHLEEWFKQNGKKNPVKIMEKIRECKSKGYIQFAKDSLENKQVQAVINLTKVANIGPAKAKELYSKYGITTVDELHQKYTEDKSIIHGKQQIGLHYYHDLNKRIPRGEMDVYYNTFREICSKISPDMKFSINGSYRRNHSSSGDIDVLISGPKGVHKSLRKQFLEELGRQKIVVEVLASGAKKFMGIVKLNKYGTHRHLDVIDTDIEQYPFAQLYFTGSGGFNSHMRLLALQKGYSMNEYCLSDKKTKIPVSIKDIQDKLGKDRFDTEEDIFRFLELDYIEPQERNTATLSKLL